MTRSDSLTAQDILERLSPYNLQRVTFRMPDGVPIIKAYIDTDETGGAIVALSDEDGDS